MDELQNLKAVGQLCPALGQPEGQIVDILLPASSQLSGIQHLISQIPTSAGGTTPTNRST